MCQQANRASLWVAGLCVTIILFFLFVNIFQTFQNEDTLLLASENKNMPQKGGGEDLAL